MDGARLTGSDHLEKDPAIYEFAGTSIDAKPIEAVKEISRNPRDIGDILREHWELERMLARKEALERLAARREERGRDGESWEEQAALLQRRSARKRAIDEALDLAAQEIARRELAPDARPDGDDPLLAQALQHREERRRRMAERVVREYRRRMDEMGRAAERMGLSEDDVRQMFEDARQRRDEHPDERDGRRR